MGEIGEEVHGRHTFGQGRASSLILLFLHWATNGEFAHQIGKNRETCGCDVACIGVSISSDSRNCCPFEASIGDMLSNVNSACLCRATIATPKLLSRLTFTFHADDAPMPTPLRRDRKKNHTTPHLEPFRIPIAMTLPPCDDPDHSTHFAYQWTHHFASSFDFFLSMPSTWFCICW